MKTDNTWVKEYINFMCVEDYENAFLLKEQYIPKSLFKYRPLNDYALENLETNTAWLSDINTLNDPFESQLLFDEMESLRAFFSSNHFLDGFKSKFGIEITRKELELITKSSDPFNTYSNFCISKGIVLNKNKDEQNEVIQQQWNEVNKENKNQIRIFSLSERNDSLLMWSHYSSQHQGICIEYDYYNFDEYRAFLQPVNYSNEIFKIKKIEDLTAINVIMASICKSKEWEYEKEWRLTITSGRNINNNIVNAPIPKAVYLGARYHLNSSYKMKQLLRICKLKNIPVYQMKVHPHEYKIIEDFKVL